MTPLLLDTHVLLWWLRDSRELGPRTKKLVGDPGSRVLVSAATAWEIAIKVALGRLDLGEPPETCIPRELEGNRFQSLPISVAHALAVRRLPDYHRDPFDRLLVAQADLDGLTLVTADTALGNYGIAIADARQ